MEITTKDIVSTAKEVMKDFTADLVKKISPNERLNVLMVAAINKNKDLEMSDAKHVAHYILGFYHFSINGDKEVEVNVNV